MSVFLFLTQSTSFSFKFPGSPQVMAADKTSFDFGFPYEPYDIQRLLVQKIQNTIQNGKVGIFASPTGTGKSLSIICAVFDWLLNERQRNEQTLMNQLEDCEQRVHQYEEDSGPDWIAVYGKRLAEQRKLNELREQLEKLECYQRVEKRLQQIRKGLERSIAATAAKRRKVDNRTAAESSKISVPKKTLELEQKLIIGDGLKSAESERSDSVTEETKPQTDMQVPVLPKIIYCSRTHSQLSQFIRELQKTIYYNKVRVITLGSRQNLCVHPDVKTLRNSTLINDRCMELNNGNSDRSHSIDDFKEKGGKQCPYYRATQMDTLAERLLALPVDIEEAHGEGEKNNCCAYYAEKRAIPQAEVLVVPYNVLLSEHTRKSFGITLDRSVIIVDEAHNLSDTISSAHSVEVSGCSLSICRDQLMAYVARYNQRLSARNLLHLKQLSMLVEAFMKALQPTKKDTMSGLASLSESSVNFSKRSGESLRENSNGIVHVYTPVAFLIDCGVDNFNLFKLIEFCEQAQLARKLFGFAMMLARHHKSVPEAAQQCEKETIKTGTSAFLIRIMHEKKSSTSGKAKKTTNLTCVKENKQRPANSSAKPLLTVRETEDERRQQVPSSPLFQVLELLKALTNPSEDGRLLVHQDKNEGNIKYLHLDIAARFAPIVQQSRALLLLGGTMEPVDEFVDLLKSNDPNQKSAKPIEFFDCDHIIPPENLLAVSIDQGPTGQSMLFKFETRSNMAIMRDAGLLLVNLCSLVPGGVVVFFTSYNFEKDVYNFWEQEKIIQRIESRGKRVFREPRAAGEVQKILSEYSLCVKKATVGQTSNSSNQGHSGAVLLSVIGGKMSEGINFNDDLGRCVVVFGLPYPNMNSAELKEKFAYVDSQTQKIGPSNVLPQQASSNLYQNLCMKAVNQSIGRAIRHKNDYATIWLVDSRYGNNPKVIQRLPGWIRKSFEPSLTFGQAFRKTSQFFRSKQKNDFILKI